MPFFFISPTQRFISNLFLRIRTVSNHMSQLTTIKIDQYFFFFRRSIPLCVWICRWSIPHKWCIISVIPSRTPISRLIKRSYIWPGERFFRCDTIRWFRISFISPLLLIFWLNIPYLDLIKTSQYMMFSTIVGTSYL